MLTLEQVKLLNVSDSVFLKKWRNKKDGTKSYTTKENCLVAGQNAEWISFRNLSSYYKDCTINDYGITWSLEPPCNSYV